MRNFSFLLGVFFTVFFGVFGANTTHAQTPCHEIQALGTPLLSGFGVPFDVTTNQLVMQAACTDTGTVTITAGSNSPNLYLYETGYLWNNTWQPFTLTGSQKTGVWLTGEGSGTVTLSSTQLAETNYFVNYTCVWDGASWKCGCADTTCLTPSWQLQTFTHTVSTNGSTSSGGSSSSGGTVVPPKSILFIGNSITNAGGGQWVEVKKLFEASGRSVSTDRDAVGGKKFIDHFNRTSATNKIKSGNYETVLLQGHTQDSANRSQMLDYGGRLIDMARNAGSKPALFMTFEYNNGGGNFPRAKEAYEALGSNKNVPVAPVGMAFKLFKERHSTNLYADTVHQNGLGVYLVACTLYAFFTGESPEGISYVRSGINATDARNAQKAAWDAVQAYGQFYR